MLIMIIQERLKELAKDISVLYVEDDSIARDKTSKLLRRIFDNVDVAINGNDGLSLYMQNKYDLIISDIIMNNLNGLEMVKAIKNISSSQRVIFLSAYTEQKYLSEAIELGVDSFIFKPMDLDKLYIVLERVLNQIHLTKDSIEYKENLERLVEQRTADLVLKNNELLKMIDEVNKANRLKEEMKIAQKVQENFLPKEIPNSKNIQISTYFQPAEYVGGDYYDMFYSNNGLINIIIADVSGHGIAPAITMSTFRGVCRSILALDIKFEEQINLINNFMCEDSKQSDFFITAFFIKYYENENRFEYISAGHNEVLFYNTILDELEKLKSTAIPFGIFADTKYPIISKKINKNDFLVLYTDGLIEATNENKEMFGLHRLTEILNKSKNSTVNEILENIKNNLDKFTKEESKNDDTTVLVSKFV